MPKLHGRHPRPVAVQPPALFREKHLPIPRSSSNQTLRASLGPSQRVSCAVWLFQTLPKGRESNAEAPQEPRPS